MSFMEDTAAVAKEVVQLAKEKTAQTVEVQKLRYAIFKAKNQRKQQYEALGKAYYNSLQTQRDEEGLSLLVEQIKATTQRIAELNAKLKQATE